MLCPSAKGLHPSRIALFRVTEGDLIGGSKNSYIATLVEQHSRYVMLVKVATRTLKASSRR
jgi:IS30 family transposase